ncbi:MAG TPA: hypothetical protein VFS00_01490, partial [Polyangiaceae bacterium]|nr:hypothetical protein [Polyangiaceae bacterium]
NRNNSHDSRSWFGGKGGGVPQIDLLGRAAFVWLHVEPGGSFSFDRFLADVNGAPVLPAAHAATLGPALERCLSARPPREKTTPPPPAQSANPG